MDTTIILRAIWDNVKDQPLQLVLLLMFLYYIKDMKFIRREIKFVKQYINLKIDNLKERCDLIRGQNDNTCLTKKSNSEVNDNENKS